MTFWTWFTQNGDRVLAFLSMLSVALKSVDGLPPNVSQAILIVGIAATVAHQTLFPNALGPTAPKGN